MAALRQRKAEASRVAGEDTAGVHVWLILWKTFSAVSRHAERHIAVLGLGRSDFGVLEVLLAKGPQPVNAIGPKVDLTPGSISVAVDRLVRKGLVRRRNDPADRRVRRVELTEKGRKVIAAGFRDHQKAMEVAAIDLTKAERAGLIRLLKKYGKGAAARL